MSTHHAPQDISTVSPPHYLAMLARFHEAFGGREPVNGEIATLITLAFALEAGCVVAIENSHGYLIAWSAPKP